ncbi:hypothetical protein SGFS_042800 [Streptomyces graminofaciens]|uniref:Uncharacterized protein n=1 Tax=Streptomyces graminofaciens TaxID=68212 RepID=A0ABM7FAI0_9ACTN|nr:hypothetical protein [Streptomyces graminofaciens]BBC32986.1 hypothetical protein SGFS_042800 [Streptomyces graminofaciens]
MSQTATLELPDLTELEALALREELGETVRIDKAAVDAKEDGYKDLGLVTAIVILLIPIAKSLSSALAKRKSVVEKTYTLTLPDGSVEEGTLRITASTPAPPEVTASGAELSAFLASQDPPTGTQAQ